MEIVHYLAIVRRRLWLILLCGILAGGAAYGVSRVLPPGYQTSATLLLRHNSADGELSYDTLLALQQMAQTYSRMLVQQPVLDAVVQNLSLNEDTESLGKRVEAEAMPNTSLIKITVDDRDPRRAAAVANEMAKVFIEQHEARELEHFANVRKTLEEQIGALDESIRTIQARITNSTLASERIELEQELRGQRSARSTLAASLGESQFRQAQLSDDIAVVEEARPPERPARPRIVLNTIVGAFAGLGIALSLAFLSEFLRQIRSLPSPAQPTRSSGG
jgi:non-specific protein-tyrosine kinase